ncbi:5542_t:CDS:2, partial [Paraglomus brasilianum]
TTLSLGKYEPRGPNSALFALTLFFAVDVAFNGKDLRLLCIPSTGSFFLEDVPQFIAQ